MPIKSNLIYYALALITGALIPVQASTNAAFSKSTGSPIITGLIIFVVGLMAMVTFIFFRGIHLPSYQQIISAPIYAYLGGIIVAIYVVMITILVPGIGVATAIAFVVTGQILCAIVIDHFGLFNVHVRSIDISRITGILLMAGGICLMKRK